MPQHQGFGHVTLSVSDLERSADFYNRAFSAQAMAGEDELGPFVLCLGQNFMLGLRRWESTPDGDTFRFDRVGLDHMGIHVDGDAELDKWRAHLEEQGIDCDGPVASPYGLHLHMKDPDGIATEFFSPGSPG